jgi:hypothetical protein
VQVPAVLAGDAPIAGAVLAECNIESMVGNYVYSGVKRRHPGAQILRGSGDGNELRLTILAVRGVGPGPYTEKSIDLRAELVRDGKLVDSNVFHRAVGGSRFGRFRGACDVFARVATTLGRDIGAWLVAAVVLPTPPDAQPLAPVRQPAAPTPSSTANDRSAAEARAVDRLQALDKLRIEGLITPAEYEEKRVEILNGL